MVPFFIKRTTGCLEVFTSLGKIVIIYEVITCVIGRVYIDHLDGSKVILAENFKHIKIVSLDVKILGIPKIFGSIKVRPKSFVSSLISKP